MKNNRLIAPVLALVAALLVSSCSSQAAEASTVRVGYMPNLTHAPALLGVEDGLFEEALSEQGVKLETTVFNAGPDIVTALFGDSLDIAYIGPNPTINAYVESGGDAVRVIAGAASGGAALVVREDIVSPDDLKGKVIATPQLGNTQDVAFRYWLTQLGLSADTNGGGDVSIQPQSNADGLSGFSQGTVDGAWVPEPWVSNYVAAGAHVLVDESQLWDGGQFVTTNIIVRTAFLEANPEIVRAFLKAHVNAVSAIELDSATATEKVRAAISELTQSEIDSAVFVAAWQNVTFTYDPLPATLKESADHAVAVGLLDEAGITSAGGLDALYSLALLNEVLSDAGLDPVSS